MKRGDLVICNVKVDLEVNSKTIKWKYKEDQGTLLHVKKSFRDSNMYLVKLSDGSQRYFYEDSIRLDKVRIRQNILNQLGV